MKKVLCILEHRFEEIEAITPVDLLRRAGLEVVMASLSRLEVTGKSGITVHADALLDHVIGDNFDALFLPGGPAVGELRKDERVISLVHKFHSSGKLIAAICAAPLLLKDADLTEGKRITAHFSATGEIPHNTGEKVELDGMLLTSRGAGTALDFGLALVGLLAGEAARDDVAKGVMA